MQIHKAHGAGNDFVVVPDRDGRLDLTAEAVVALCDRRFGIGADGVLRLAPSVDADVFMDYRNGGDGAPVEMCGNGVRVVAAHLVEHGWTDQRVVRVDTRAGVRTAVVDVDGDGRVTSVEVDMGPPTFGAAAVGLDPAQLLGGDRAPDGHGRLEADGTTVDFTPVSMGNPHAVVVVDDPTTAPVATLGPALERHPAFGAGTNVGFAAVVARSAIDLRVWERGVGETMACGTGVCGAVAALTADGRLDADVDVAVSVPGGTLHVRWAGGADDPVMLRGPAVEVATITASPALLHRAGLAAPAPA